MDSCNLLAQALLLLTLGSVATGSTRLQVTPKSRVSLSPPWSRIFRGENVTLTSHLGNSSLLNGTTSWTHDSSPLTESTSSPTISGPRELDSGEYRCQGGDAQPSDPVRLGVFSGESGQVLRGKAIIFPRESASDYVLLTARHQKPLHSFTLCMKASSDLTRDYSLFSYSTRAHSNALLLYLNRPGEFSLTIGHSEIVFRTPQSSKGPIRVCVTWESATGIATLWVDGKPQGRKGVSKGYVLDANAKIILGQEQDSYGGGFDAKQSLVGEVWDVHLWDTIIPMKPTGPTCRIGNVLDWHSLSFQSYGYVVIKPKLWA
ncbi:mucosal pentraxin-like [Sorex araneus]|uniref:mucosal pentraxin-like n=1 Tax=Sorex araneus TaxID=42254 RepID=UPI0024335840|nr:mucosal pentraxin-like [Sorex araneus]